MVDLSQLTARTDPVRSVVIAPAEPRRLRAEHVELTAICDADLQCLFEWINDREEVLLNASYSPVHERDHLAWFESVRRRPDLVIFAIRLLEDGALIGSCQLRNVDRRHGSADLQIRIGARDARGKGYGTEAVRLLLLHAFRDLGLERVQLQVFAGNERAIRAYQKAGFCQEGRLRSAAYIDGERCDIIVLGILRDEAGVD